MRDQPKVKRPIIRWTVGLALLIGTFVSWQTRRDKPEYFLRKAVVEHPNDVTAWLKLASHYRDEGDVLANDSGDEADSPPDPTPSYQEALDCINRAVDLGARGFEVDLARAQLADAVGDRRASVLYARDALSHGPPSAIPEGDRNEEIKWLREMITRNDAAPSADEAIEARERRVRDERLNRLPGALRWASEIF